MLLHPQVEKQLAVYAKEAYPSEAVGLIDASGKIFLLDNLSESSTDTFQVSKQQIRDVFTLPDFNGVGDITLWHSHPGGLVGPSREDMRNKTPFSYHLVVTLINDEIKLTWY